MVYCAVDVLCYADGGPYIYPSGINGARIVQIAMCVKRDRTIPYVGPVCDKISLQDCRHSMAFVDIDWEKVYSNASGQIVNARRVYHHRQNPVNYRVQNYNLLF